MRGPSTSAASLYPSQLFLHLYYSHTLCLTWTLFYQSSSSHPNQFLLPYPCSGALAGSPWAHHGCPCAIPHTSASPAPVHYTSSKGVLALHCLFFFETVKDYLLPSEPSPDLLLCLPPSDDADSDQLLPFPFHSSQFELCTLRPSSCPDDQRQGVSS